MLKIKDQLNRIIAFEETPNRIISLVPSQTELLCDLGLESSIIGVTKFCVHPHFIKTNAAVVGGTKKIHIEKIKALKPNIILCNKEENTKEIVEACKAICTVHVSDIYTIKDSLQLIKQYGILFNVEENAIRICNEIKIQQKGFEHFIKNKKQFNVAYYIWKNPWMVAANNTFINYLLAINGFNNYYKSQSRYPEITLQVNLEIDLVMLSSEPFPFKEMHKKDLKTFFPNAKIILVDGEMFSWYGSRLIKAFAYFKALRLNL